MFFSILRGRSNFTFLNILLAIFFIHIRPNVVNANGIMDKLMDTLKTHLPPDLAKYIDEIGKKDVNKMDDFYTKKEEMTNMILEEEKKENGAANHPKDVKKQATAEETIVIKKLDQKHHILDFGKFKENMDNMFKWRMNGKNFFLDSLHSGNALIQAIFTGNWANVNKMLPNMKKMIKNVQDDELKVKQKEYKLGEVKPLNLSDRKNLGNLLRMSLEMATGKFQENRENFMLYFLAGKAVTDGKFEFQNGKENKEEKPWYSSLFGGFGGHGDSKPLLKDADKHQLAGHGSTKTLRRSKRQVELAAAGIVLAVYLFVCLIFKQVPFSHSKPGSYNNHYFSSGCCCNSLW